MIEALSPVPPTMATKSSCSDPLPPAAMSYYSISSEAGALLHSILGMQGPYSRLKAPQKTVESSPPVLYKRDVIMGNGVYSIARRKTAFCGAGINLSPDTRNSNTGDPKHTTTAPARNSLALSRSSYFASTLKPCSLRKQFGRGVSLLM